MAAKGQAYVVNDVSGLRLPESAVVRSLDQIAKVGGFLDAHSVGARRCSLKDPLSTLGKKSRPNQGIKNRERAEAAAKNAAGKHADGGGKSPAGCDSCDEILSKAASKRF